MSAGSRSLEDIMRKATAVYHAPEGDSKEAEMAGVLFKDGEPVELNSDDHGHLIRKLPTNQHFEIAVSGDDGTPSADDGKRDFKGAIEEARDHDFEADRRIPRRGRPPKNPVE
jgi:hypothetical protein